MPDKMRAVPITLKKANIFVKKYHRHNLPVTGARFAIAALKDGRIAGVGIAGRPVARLLDDGKTLEILRVCTDGTKNANSFLYSRIRRIAQLMGYKKVITYTLRSESGASLRALDAKIEAITKPGSWNRKNRPRTQKEIYLQEKFRWIL